MKSENLSQLWLEEDMMAEDESERGNSSRAEKDIAGFKHILGAREDMPENMGCS